MIKILLTLLLIISSSCGLLDSAVKSKKSLTVNKDAVVILGDEEKEIKKDEGMDLPSESFLVRSKGHIPVYVIPLNSSFQEVNVKLSQFEDSELTPTFRKSINST